MPKPPLCRLLDKEKDSRALWKLYALLKEDRELVRRLACGTDLFCHDLLKLLRKLAVELSKLKGGEKLRRVG
jgi:hypothetical protein